MVEGRSTTDPVKTLDRIDKMLLDALQQDCDLPVTELATKVSLSTTPCWKRDAVNEIPEVVEFYRMSGEVDYLMKVVVPDIAAYDTVYKRLIAVVQLSDVSSSFAMEELKFTTALPLDYA